jgi:glycerophosphoryl diester phosphodiesterase
MFMNLAHRGASEYAPENTFAAFYLGLEQGANGIETDIKRTKDGVLILFHDDTLDRTTNGKGYVGDYTYEELMQLDAGKHKSDIYKWEKLVSFEDFLKYFGTKDLHFAIELKDSFVEQDTLALIKKYGVENKVTITSFNFDNLIRTRELDKNIKIGYLIGEINIEAIEKLKEIGANQVCPSAKSLSLEKVQWAKNQGFTVRAWGVKDENLMLHSLNCGVDGMTVNFPDKLAEALKRQ